MRLFICASTIAWAASFASAATYDLTTDFSNGVNPNGVWSFRQGATPLTHHTSAGNALDTAATNGYWGTADNNYAPSVIKTTGNGTAAPGYTNADFLAGDVIAHSTNPGGGSMLEIVWTAPSTGLASFTGSVWYAHSVVTRSNDYAVVYNDLVPLFQGTVDGTANRNNPSTFNSSTIVPGTVAVTAGQTLAIWLTPTAGQTFGSLAGVQFNVNLVPEPTVLGVMAVAATLLGRRRRTV